MKDDITELRSHLFQTLRDLRDKQSPMDVDRARVVSQVAGALIDSARVEIDFLRVTGASRGTGFIPEAKVEVLTQGDGKAAELPNGITSITRHACR